MFEAITYDSMLENINENDISADAIGILLARPKSEAGKNIVDSLPYYHHRSGKSINFYLPGYGAYWYGICPDEIDIVKIDGIQWSFSNQKYVEFVNDIEKNSRWKYSGESELLLIEYKNGFLDYSNVLCFNLDAMLRDKTISSINMFFEGIFRETSKRKSVTQISDISGLKTLGQVTIDSVLEAMPSFFSGAIRKERHYLVKDYTMASSL